MNGIDSQMDNYNFVSILGFKVYSDKLSKITLQTEKCRAVNTISPNSYGISVRDREFRQTLQGTDFLMLDGVYFALASIFLLGKNIKKNQGPDIYRHFIERLDQMKGKAFFLGSSENILIKIKERLAREYPAIEVDFFSPPFKEEFLAEENASMISKINEFRPDIVFVGMTAPKQEKWTVRNKDKVNASLIISIGNVFDWYARTQKAVHPFWFRIRLGWLIRIFQRPEIFKRNIGNQMLFFWHLVLIILRIKKNQYG